MTEIAFALAGSVSVVSLAVWDSWRRHLDSKRIKSEHLKEFQNLVSEVVNVQNDYGKRLKTVEEWSKNEEKRRALTNVGRSR